MSTTYSIIPTHRLRTHNSRLKVVLWFGKLAILNPVSANWDTVGTDHIAHGVLQELKDASILEILTPATMLDEASALREIS